MPRIPELALVTKLGSKSIGTPEGEPRMGLIKQNAKELASVRESGLVVVVSSGAELFGKKTVLTSDRKKRLKERKAEIRIECGSNKEELESRVRALNLSVNRHIHRVGQVKLMEIWGEAFAEYGLGVLPELLDGQHRDLTEEISLADEIGAILVFNGHGSLEPDGKAGDNDLNLPGVVDWVAPYMNEYHEDPNTRLCVLGITDPATRGLLNKHGDTIEVFRGRSIERQIHPDRTISRGGPESKAFAFSAIKEKHPRSRVGISANRAGIIADFINEGKADTLVETMEVAAA